MWALKPQDKAKCGYSRRAISVVKSRKYCRSLITPWRNWRDSVISTSSYVDSDVTASYAYE